MALVIGTDAGFVTVSPTANPSSITTLMDTRANTSKYTSPAGAIKITEIGWYCSNATQEANFEVGLYDHDSGGNLPDNLLHVERTNAKGTTEGWKKVTVDWEISGSTIYWFAVQLDDTSTTTNIDRNFSSGERYTSQAFKTTLENPTTVSSGVNNFFLGIYAVYETAGTNTQINIGDDWKEIAAAQINIGDTWKAVAGMQVNIGDTWKTVF